ncbi:MAG: ribosome biogenesis GTP-binding protein YihA/YsxC [Rhodospirillales bacterium]
MENGEGTAADQAALAERARRLFAQPCRFVAAAVGLDHIPPGGLPEIAFAGRSNVGKSSLINALVGQKALARTSQTPGRTRQLNFFDLGGRMMLVDLPGYGYASAPKTEIAAWTRLVDAYLCGRPSLRRVLLLIDARRGPGELDQRVMSLLDRAAVSYQVVLTKADKAGRGELAHTGDRVAALRGHHTALHPDLAVTSVAAAEGIAELRTAVAPLAHWDADLSPSLPDRG